MDLELPSILGQRLSSNQLKALEKGGASFASSMERTGGHAPVFPARLYIYFFLGEETQMYTIVHGAKWEKD